MNTKKLNTSKSTKNSTSQEIANNNLEVTTLKKIKMIKVNNENFAGITEVKTESILNNNTIKRENTSTVLKTEIMKQTNSNNQVRTSFQMYAHQISSHPSFDDLYGSSLKLDYHKEILENDGIVACPPIYVNAKNEAVREVAWLKAVQEYDPNSLVNVCVHDSGDLESWDIVRYANVYGHKSYRVLIKEIISLKSYIQLQQGQRTDVSGAEKHNTTKKIADILDISESLINRLMYIDKICPRLIEKLDNAERKGTDEKLSVSKQAQICKDIVKLIAELPDEEHRETWLRNVYESDTLPIQLFGLIRDAKRKMKTGISLSDSAQHIIKTVEEAGRSPKEEESSIDLTTVEIEVDRPKLQVSFDLQARKNVDPQMLFQILFPQPAALEYESKFIKVVEDIYQNVSHLKAA